MSNFYQDIINSKSPIVMGILNVTPDSFSDGGKYLKIEDALKHAEKLLNDGADIIDIGGESTRPGSKPVSLDEELSRVIPVIEKIISLHPSAKISIDTTKSIVAEEAIKSGACLINDISGGIFDENNFIVAAKYDIPYVIMHIKGKPSLMQNSPYYDDVLEELLKFFRARINIANEKNVKKIILDPGIGFGKRVQDNYNILNNIDLIKYLGYPVLIGVSKKSFLGKSLNLDINERLTATIISETIAVSKGANIVRTHNVKNAVELKNITKNLHKYNYKINV